MIRVTIFALAIAGFAAQASAATVTSLGSWDSQFTALCSAGAPAGLTTGQASIACEVAVAEARGGNGTAGGDQEITLRDPQTNGYSFTGTNGQLAINADDAYGNPGATYGFSIAYDAASDLMTYGVGPQTITRSVVMDPARTLFIRLRTGGAGDFNILNMSLTGAAGTFSLGSMTDPGVSYLRVSGFDFASDFTLSGTYEFTENIVTSGPNRNNGSRQAVQFKFTDIATVPVPAAGALLLAGLGALGFRRR